MKSIDIKKYCGLLQNRFLEQYNANSSATGTGESIWFKEMEYQKIKHLKLPVTKISNQYVLMVGKKLIKTIL